MAIQDFTQTGHVTDVALAEVNKPPPPLVADEQMQSRETHNLQSRSFVRNVVDQFFYQRFGVLYLFYVVVLPPNYIFCAACNLKSK